MFFFWLYALAWILLFLSAKFFFIVPTESYPLILSLAMMIVLPVMIPLLRLIRQDVTESYPVFTRAGIVGIGCSLLVASLLWSIFDWSFSTVIFFWMVFIAAYFRVESRIFFMGALMGLIYTILTLLLGMEDLADKASIFVYLALVAGVIVELFAPVFARIHRGSPVWIQFSDEFVWLYRRECATLSFLVTAGLQLLIIVLLIGRGKWWIFESDLYPFIGLGIWFFFFLFLLLSQKVYTLQHFFTDLMKLRFRHWQKWGLHIRSIALGGLSTLLATWGVYSGMSFSRTVFIVLSVFALVSVVAFALIRFFSHAQD